MKAKKIAIKGLIAVAALVAVCMFFSGTIRTNDSINISSRELKVHVFIKNSFSELNRKICYSYHL